MWLSGLSPGRFTLTLLILDLYRDLQFVCLILVLINCRESRLWNTSVKMTWYLFMKLQGLCWNSSSCLSVEIIYCTPLNRYTLCTFHPGESALYFLWFKSDRGLLVRHVSANLLEMLSNRSFTMVCTIYTDVDLYCHHVADDFQVASWNWIYPHSFLVLNVVSRWRCYEAVEWVAHIVCTNGAPQNTEHWTCLLVCIDCKLKVCLRRPKSRPAPGQQKTIQHL